MPINHLCSKTKYPFFYNHNSQKFIDAPCDSFAFAEWGIDNSKVFIPDIIPKAGVM